MSDLGVAEALPYETLDDGKSLQQRTNYDRRNGSPGEEALGKLELARPCLNTTLDAQHAALLQHFVPDT